MAEKISMDEWQRDRANKAHKKQYESALKKRKKEWNERLSQRGTAVKGD